MDAQNEQQIIHIEPTQYYAKREHSLAYKLHDLHNALARRRRYHWRRFGELTWFTHVI
jgi:hypothetical protein